MQLLFVARSWTQEEESAQEESAKGGGGGGGARGGAQGQDVSAQRGESGTPLHQGSVQEKQGSPACS